MHCELAGCFPPGRGSRGADQSDRFLCDRRVDRPGVYSVGSAEDSYDQSDFIRGRSTSKRLTLVHNTNKNGYGIRHGDWVYLTTKSGAVSKVPDWFDRENGYTTNPHPGELYNLRDDLAQKKNLYAEHPEIVKELAARLAHLQQHSQVR